MTSGDLEAARDLARAGVPLFMARPDATSTTGYRLPMRWERDAAADPALVDALPDGWALCAVMGYGLDLVDLDPRNGDGAALPALPPALATARTPSGGTHHFVLSLGLPSLDGVVPGLDYKGGEPSGVGRGFAFIAPTVRLSKVDGRPHPYQWVGPSDVRMLDAYREQFRPNHPMFESLRQAIMARREQRAEGVVRVVPESVAVREWHAALARLEADLRRWAATGWGGEAHAGLLAHTTHLARLAPEQAERSYLEAFTRAGLAPDEADLAKLDSALRTAVPDVVVPDAELSGQELFWAGVDVVPPFGPALNGSRPSGAPGAFDFCDPAWLDHPPEPPEPAWGSFGGPRGLFYGEGVHWLQGESESGKTWVALALALEVLTAGERVIIVDYEDTRDAVLSRLRDLGVAAEQLGRLVYVGGHDVTHAEIVAHLAGTDRAYALLVLDGVTSALSSAGLKGNDGQELTLWADAVPRRARAAVCVDHVVKSVDERNGNAIGSQAKKSVVTASSYEVRTAAKFGRGGTGVVELRLHKDKRGGLRGRVPAVVRLRFASDPVTGAVTLAVTGAAAPVTAEGFLGQELTAEADLRVKAIVAAWHDDPRSNPSQSQRVLWQRAREMDYRGNKATMTAAYRAYVAGIVPMNPDPVDDDE